MKKQYSILFIGNSMTYYHDMPTAIFEKMAASAGFDVTVRSVTAGGRFLREHLSLDDEPARAAKAALAADKAGVYDFVVLQEGMPDLYTRTENFYEAVRILTGKIRDLGAKPVLYARMGNKRGNPELNDPACTYEHVYQTIVKAHETISQELDIPLAWAVRAAYEMNEEPLPFDLYDPDRSHPSYAGSYVAALCVFTALFGADPTMITYDGELPPEQAALCRESVKKVQT